MAFFCKARVLLRCHMTCPCFMLICWFSLVATLKPAYLNNAGALLNCYADTAGLSAFSCFVGVFFFKYTFPITKVKFSTSRSNRNRHAERSEKKR